jgi:hypothetical protein
MLRPAMIANWMNPSPFTQSKIRRIQAIGGAAGRSVVRAASNGNGRAAEGGYFAAAST